MTSSLKKCMSDRSAAVSAELARLLSYLSYTDDSFACLFDSMRYSVSAGGKRIRPFLTLEFCRLFGGDEAAAMPFACAIELVHTYSLIHDDLPCMDDDEFRRGKLTNHRVYGEATALLAGDALLTYAFEVAASNSLVAPKIALDAVMLLSRAAGARGMIGGQQLDLIGENKKYNTETLVKMNKLKTGELIRAACLLGALAAGATAEKCESAAAYAAGIGQAFQIVDDILDVTGDAALLGKKVHADAACGKTTYMTFMTPEAAHDRASELTDAAVNAIAGYDGSEILCELARYLLDRKN